jgi:UDP-N-acetylglucosamine 4,6-dehydratase
MYKNQNLLITGGTGTFGSNFVRYIVKSKNIKFNKIIIFSRDEFKQLEMQQKFSEKERANLRFFIGDVRDRERLKFALHDVDVVVHAAALKQVPTAEYNPMEVIKTNVIGTQNLIDTSLEKKVKKFIFLSTDKACAPLNLYGATKLSSEKLVTSANNVKGKRNIIFTVVRYGNVMSSRGSVIPEFIKQSKSGTLKITDKNMTRFNITLEESINLVFWAIKNAIGSEIIIPKIPSYKITDLAKSIAPNCKIKIIGIRPGEKIHEEMISKNDSISSIDIGKYYVILPPNEKNISNYYKHKFKSKEVAKDFNYSSGTNEHFLSIKEIRKLIEK